MACFRLCILWDLENLLPPRKQPQDEISPAFHVGSALVSQGAAFVRRLLGLTDKDKVATELVGAAAEWGKRMDPELGPSWRAAFSEWHFALSHVPCIQLLDAPGKKAKVEADHRVGDAITMFADSCAMLGHAGVLMLLSTVSCPCSSLSDTLSRTDG